MQLIVLDGELVDYVGDLLPFVVEVVDLLFDLMFLVPGLAQLLGELVHQLRDVAVLPSQPKAITYLASFLH